MPFSKSLYTIKEETPIFKRMVIDCEKVAHIIINFIRQKVEEEAKNGVVLGLSGGIDSSVVAYLAVRAMENPSKVHALYLFDITSEKQFKNYAQEVARQLGLVFKEVDITEESRRQGAYKSPIIRFTTIVPFLNKFLIWASNKVIYPLFFKKSGFIVTLERGASCKNWVSRMIYNTIAAAVEESFNVRHRVRRKILEEYSQIHNLLPIGCTNRSERFVGWFVPGGIDDLSIEPIGSLYKCQVRQLAKWLGVPEKIINQVPSPDMFKRVGDEEMIGYSYEKIDKVSYVVEHGLDENILIKENITKEEIDGIKLLHQLSRWKRRNTTLNVH